MTLLENLHYDPDTGIFTWIRTGRGRRKRAGNAAPNGYRSIRIGGKLYYEHRLAWLAIHGAFPPHEIDHINGNPSDNRISNLRLATHRENSSNTKRHKDNRSGLKGVCYDARREKWFSHVQGQFLAYASTKEEAYKTYCDAARTLFGEFFNPGEIV